MAVRRDLEGVGFRDAFRISTSRAPALWNSVATGIGAMGTLWLVHLWLMTSEGVGASIVGVLLLPVGAALTLWGWVYSRIVVMLLGILVGFLGAAAPFWLW